MITGASLALQALGALIDGVRAGASHAPAGEFSTGQSLPTGAGSPPAGATPASQFAATTLSFLMSLQQVGGCGHHHPSGGAPPSTNTDGSASLEGTTAS